MYILEYLAVSQLWQFDLATYWLLVQDLKSVSVALENPILHCTAFYARPEGPGNTAAEGNDTGDDNGKQLLSKDEIILRIAIREYDALHVTHQVICHLSPAQHSSAAMSSRHSPTALLLEEKDLGYHSLGRLSCIKSMKRYKKLGLPISAMRAYIPWVRDIAYSSDWPEYTSIS